MLKKIAITGPESTGKSTLAAQLADFYQTIWVPEFARTYIENLNRPYVAEDVEAIAKGQLEVLKKAEKAVKNLLIADTELLVIKIWFEHAFGFCPDWILQELETQTFDLYLLMDVDLPWEPDPQREHPDKRNYFADLYEQELKRYGFPYKRISGSEQLRFDNARQAIDDLLKN